MFGCSANEAPKILSTDLSHSTPNWQIQYTPLDPHQSQDPPTISTHQLLDPNLPLDFHHLLIPNSLDPIAPRPYHPLDPHRLLNPHHSYIPTTPTPPPQPPPGRVLCTVLINSSCTGLSSLIQISFHREPVFVKLFNRIRNPSRQ